MRETLANKYRPKEFNDVVGQTSTVQILEKQIETGNIRNTYLFVGGAGTGKTTLARILANKINKGVGAPIEIDAASNNGVENIRTIISDAYMQALDSEYKVYILDECHMLSNGAWNALLKLLEEPPLKTIFIFCTTEPQKIPDTILSRVQRYDFQRLSQEQIVNRLSYIIDQENTEEFNIYNYETESLEYIAKMADGGMRSAITMLEKCINHSSAITMENIIKILGLANYQVMFDLTNYIIDYKEKEMLQVLNELHEDGVDLKNFMKEYSLFILDLCKYELTQDLTIIKIPYTYKEILEYTAKGNKGFLVSFLDKLIEINSIIKWEHNCKQIIEMHLLLLCSK